VPSLASPAVVMKVVNAGKEALPVELVLEPVDKLMRVEATVRSKATLAPGRTTRVRVELPPLKSGFHVIHVSVRDAQGRVLNWANTQAQVGPGVTLARADFDKPLYRSGDAVRARIGLEGDIPPPGATLKASLVDTRGRLLGEQDVKLKPGARSAEVSIPLLDPVAHLADLRVAVAHPRGPLAAEDFPTALRPPRKDVDDFKWYLWRQGTRVDERRIEAQIGVDYGMVGGEVGPRANHGSWVGTFDRLIKPVRSVQAGENNARQPCYTNPAYQQNVYGYCREKVSGEYSRLGVYDYMLMDEEQVGGKYCSSPSCRFHFGRWLRRTYKTLDALNRSWGTSFKNWRDVQGILLDDIKDPKRVGGFVDHRR